MLDAIESVEESVKDIVGFTNYFAEEFCYSSNPAPPSYNRPLGC